MAQKTVLLAEDDLEIRDILQDLLEAEGYDVIPASHGRQALEFLQGARGDKDRLPDLVVLDLMMPRGRARTSCGRGGVPAQADPAAEVLRYDQRLRRSQPVYVAAAGDVATSGARPAASYRGGDCPA